MKLKQLSFYNRNHPFSNHKYTKNVHPLLDLAKLVNLQLTVDPPRARTVTRLTMATSREQVRHSDSTSSQFSKPELHFRRFPVTDATEAVLHAAHVLSTTRRAARALLYWCRRKVHVTRDILEHEL